MIVKREPDGRMRGIGPLDPMADPGRDQDPVAGSELSRLRLAVDEKPCPALQQHDPLGMGLIVPRARWRRLARKD